MSIFGFCVESVYLVLNAHNSTHRITSISDAAMVIITTMVTKMYFPSWLEPRDEPTTHHFSHAYMNTINHAYKSDLSDDEEEEETEGLLDTEKGEGTKQQKGEERKENGTMLRSGASSFLSEYDSGLQTKESVYSNLAICAIMLNLTFVIWGLLQVSFTVQSLVHFVGCARKCICVCS